MESNLFWTVLGSGSGNPSKNRACAGHLLSVNGRSVMFDCGSGVTSSYLRSGLAHNEVESIVVSHTHADHISDLPLLIQWLKVSKRIAELSIYLPSEAVDPITIYLNTVYLFKEKLPFQLNLIPIEGDFTLLDGNIIIAPVANSHESGNKAFIDQHGYPNRMECYSFLINSRSMRRILYSGDIGSLEDIENNLQNLDLLVIETSHIDMSEFAKLLDEHSIKRVILSHIADDRYFLIHKFAEEYSGAVDLILAEDGLTTML